MKDHAFYTDAHYPRVARDREWYRRLLTRPRFRAIHRTGWIRPRAKILEVGCDDGTLLHMLEGAGATVFGIDLNADALRQSQHPRLSQARADALPFSSASFDVCVASHVIEHLESPNCFLHEAARVLRRGGKLILLYPWEIVRGMTIVPDIVMSGRFPSLSLMRRIHRHRVSPTRLCGFAEGTGMRHEHSRAFLGLPNFAVQYLTVLGKH